MAKEGDRPSVEAPASGRPVELLYLEDAYRKTLITEVAAVHGQGVLLPKTMYYGTSRRYHHPQPPDRGHLLVGGHKLKLDRVAWRRDGLAHVVSGPAPKAGEKVLAHLDWDRRHLMMRAHAAMHVLEHAVVAERRGEFAKAPEVQNNGAFRATLRLDTRGPKGVADVLQRANAIIRERLPIGTRWMTREEAARRTTAQHVAIEDVAPGEPVLRVVETGSVVRVPCDAPTLRDTREVGRLVATDVLERGEGARVLFRVVEGA